jgi:hypothetical protein
LIPILGTLVLGQTPEFQVHPRAPIAVLLSTPAREPTQIAPREVLEVLGRALDRDTDLGPVVLAAEEVADCAAALKCFSERARDRTGAELLLLLSLLARPDQPDQITALLIEVARAEVIAELPRSTLAPVGEVDPLLSRLLADPLERRGHWKKMGIVEVSLGVGGTTLMVDTSSIASVGGRSAKLVQVHSGKRIIRALHPTLGEVSAEIDVPAGSAISISLDDPRWHPNYGRIVLFWTGVGVGVAGAAFAIAAAIYTSQHAVMCDVDCSSSGLVTVEQMFGSSNPDRGAILALPLGYSLFAMGAAWSAGIWWFDSEVPWLEAVVGFAIGAAAYGVSAIIDATL